MVLKRLWGTGISDAIFHFEVIDYFTFFIAFFNIFKFHNCCLQVSNGYFIATFSENVKNHKYLANRKR